MGPLVPTLPPVRGRADRRLRIILLSQYFPPEVGATQSRMQSFAEYLAARGFLRREAGRTAARIVDLALDEPRTTGAAMPGLAAVRKIEPGGERRLQHRLAGGDPERAAVRLDAYAMLGGGQLRRASG